MEKISTKQKIMNCAIDLFAKKGYTETTIRELAAAVGVKEASIYNHFPSKEALFKSIMDEYSKITVNISFEKKLSALIENPTADCILSLMPIHFPEGKEEYYLKQMYVIFQEQYRNPIASKYVSDGFILGSEQYFKSIIHALIDNGVLKKDTNIDFWAEMQASILYTFASRALLGIGDSSPDFTGVAMSDMLLGVYDLMLRTCGLKKGL